MSLEKQSKNKSTREHAQKREENDFCLLREGLESPAWTGPSARLSLPGSGSSVMGITAPLAAFDSFC